MLPLFKLSGFLCLISCLVFSSNALAENAPQQELNPVVVTATRTAQTADETLASVTVITRDDIERSQSQDLFEVLRTQAGVDIARTGNAGGDVSLFLRGTNSNHTLTLIDGVRASSATTGKFSLTALDLSQVERIEIVRGPRASLYGSDAIGGVIQIFTRKSTGFRIRAEGGSFGTKKLDFGLGGGDKIKYSLNASLKDIDGYSATNENNVFSYDPDKDSFKAKNLSFSLGLPITEKINIDFTTWYNNNETEFDTGVSDNINKTSNLKLNYATNTAWSQSYSIGYASDETQTDSPFVLSSIFSERKIFDWQNDIVIGTQHLITAGINYYEDQVDNFDNGTNSLVFDEKIDNSAIYTNWQTAFGKNDFQLGLRYDDHSEFGSEPTGHIAWGRQIDKVKVRASYGTAFKAPTVNELFHPGFFGSFAGNPDLQAETSGSFEIGANHAFSKAQRFDVSIYDTRIEDLIAFEGTNSQAINIGEASIRGLELGYTFNNNIWVIQGNFTLQDATNEDTNSPLLRRADQKMAVNVSHSIKKTGNIAAELILSSDRPDIGTQLPGYGVLNMSTNYPISKKLMLQGRIENLFDKEYETVSGYNTAARSAFVALQYKN